MATLGSLIITLEANTAKFEAGMTKAQYQAKQTSEAIKSSLLSIGGAIVAAFSISKIESFLTAVASSESSLLKMAGRLNTNVETLSSFGIMARKTGMDIDAFYLALTRLEKGMSAAGMKSEELTGKFDEEGEEIHKAAGAYDLLGLKADVLSKMPLANQLMEIAEAFKDNIDPADRVNVAMQLFGKTGAGMINILKGGAADIRKWIEEQENLGIITTENAKKASEFSNATKKLTTSWEIFKREIAEGVIPTLGAFIEELNRGIAKANEFDRTKKLLGETFGPEEASKFGMLGQRKAGEGPFGEAAESYYPPAPYVPAPEVRKPPTRPADTIKAGKGGGGGGGGAKDMGLDRMQSIIDGLQKDLSRLTEGSLSEIREWAKHTVIEIEKVGKKGAETETALGLVAKVETAKKQKATEDYNLFVAKSSGNAFAEIEAQGKADLDKYKGFAGAKEVIAANTAHRTLEQQVKNSQEVLGLQKNIYDSLASLTPIVEEQNALKRKSLDLEIEINKYATALKITELERAGIISKAQSDEFRGLQALEAQAKKTNLAMEQNKGISGWAFERNKTVGQQNTIKDLMGGAENFLQQSFSSGIQGVLAHDKNNLKKIGETIMQGFLGEMTKRSVTQVFDKLAEVINPNKGIGGLPASIEGSNNLTQLQTAAAAGSVKAAQALDQSAQGLTGSSKGLKDSAGGLGMSGAQLGLSAGGLMLSGIGIMTNSQALVTAGMVLQVGGLALQTAATLLMLAATTDFIPFFHSGGVVTAHSGYLAHDERLIKVQTGERVLSRKQNRDFEAGTNAGGNSVTIPPININFSPSYSYRPTQQDMNRDVKMVVKAMKREMGNIFSG